MGRARKQQLALEQQCEHGLLQEPTRGNHNHGHSYRLVPFVLGIYIYILQRPSEGQAIGWDPISFMKQPSTLLLGALIFLAGFVWEFRCVTRK